MSARSARIKKLAVMAMLVALFGDVTWKPIHHSVALSIGDLGGASSQELPKNRKL